MYGDHFTTEDILMTYEMKLHGKQAAQEAEVIRIGG